MAAAGCEENIRPIPVRNPFLSKEDLEKTLSGGSFPKKEVISKKEETLKKGGCHNGKTKKIQYYGLGHEKSARKEERGRAGRRKDKVHLSAASGGQLKEIPYGNCSSEAKQVGRKIRKKKKRIGGGEDGRGKGGHLSLDNPTVAKAFPRRGTYQGEGVAKTSTR